MDVWTQRRSRICQKIKKKNSRQAARAHSTFSTLQRPHARCQSTFEAGKAKTHSKQITLHTALSLRPWRP